MDTSEDLKPAALNQSTQPITNGHSSPGPPIEKKLINEHLNSIPYQPHSEHNMHPHMNEQPPHAGKYHN